MFHPLRLLKILSGLGLGLLISLSSAAAGELTIDNAFARATIGAGKNGTAYMTIQNDGAAPDRLLGATSEAAAKTMIHESRMVDGVMTMRHLDAITIAPGETVRLAPGGRHLMLMGLKAPLREGESLSVTLRFERSSDIAITLPIASFSANAPPAD
jgi:copper(I)-binding protein